MGFVGCFLLRNLLIIHRLNEFYTKHKQIKPNLQGLETAKNSDFHLVIVWTVKLTMLAYLASRCNLSGWNMCSILHHVMWHSVSKNDRWKWQLPTTLTSTACYHLVNSSKLGLKILQASIMVFLMHIYYRSRAWSCYC